MLDTLRPRIRNKRLTILGVGNELRGDDAIGPALVNALQGKIAATLIDAGDTPEDYWAVLEAIHPEVVLIVDAVALGSAPGDVALVEIAQLAGTRLTTHNTSIALLAQALRERTACDVLVIGIQPQELSLGMPMSQRVRATLDCLVHLFAQL